MFNLDERYQSYLTGDKKLRIDGVEERVKAYGYTDNGKDIDGYYLTTENYQLTAASRARASSSRCFKRDGSSPVAFESSATARSKAAL